MLTRSSSCVTVFAVFPSIVVSEESPLSRTVLGWKVELSDLSDGGTPRNVRVGSGHPVTDLSAVLLSSVGTLMGLVLAVWSSGTRILTAPRISCV